MGQMFTNIKMIYVLNDKGQLETLEHDDVTCRIFKVLKEVGNSDRILALNLADKVIFRLKNWKCAQITFYDVEYMIKFVLTESGYDVHKSFEFSDKMSTHYN